jgi:hypothetical protein
MVLRTKKEGKGFYIGCRSYPECKRAVWFPSGVLDVTTTSEYCQKVCFKRSFLFFFTVFKKYLY